jgi:uncharacterized protein YjbI with pentapeptide repeats
MIEIRQRETGAVLHRVEGASLERAELAGADLSRADLRGAYDRRVRWQDAAVGIFLLPLCLVSVLAALFFLLASPFLRAGRRTGGVHAAAFQLRLMPFPLQMLATTLVPPLRRLEPVTAAGAHLAGADLHGQELARANLSQGGLESADLRAVRAGSACLIGARLAGADLREADLSAADFTGADLEGTLLEGARYNTARRWPDGFDPQAHGAVLLHC